MPIRLIKLLTISAVLYQCTTSKESYYCYKVSTYTIDTVKRFIYSENLISYGDYLFEFKDLIKFNTTIHEDSDTITSIKYDTLGVYLLSGRNKLYYEFDTFALKNGLVKIGKIADKRFGFKFHSLVTDSSADLSFTPPEKIVINNFNCFVTEIVSNNKKENDSINQKVVLIKNSKFNSLYKMNGIKFPDSNYCIVGFHIYDLKNNQGFLQEIESLKPLTDKEIAICESMIKKSRSAVVDTIKGMHLSRMVFPLLPIKKLPAKTPSSPPPTPPHSITVKHCTKRP